MRAAVAGTGLADPDSPVPEVVDPSPLRRMDRYGRAGYLAGGMALAAAGRTRGGNADPRAGVVFGTAFGCRDSITEHAALLAAASAAGAVAELRPAVFVQTVHNSVNGELAIAWKLGGYSETLVSGRVAGLQAVLLASSRVAEGLQDLMLAGAAEGINDAMRRAWTEDRSLFAPRDVPLLERGAALALVAEARMPDAPCVVFGAEFFEPDPRQAVARALELLAAEGCAPSDVLPASPDLEDVLAPFGTREAPGEELFAAAGLAAAVRVAGEIRAGERRHGAVLVRDPGGPTAAVLFAAPRS